MSGCRLDWSRLANKRLGEIWIAARDRRLVTQASDRIERQLMQDPLGAGVQFLGPVRELEVYPLIVLYRVYEARNLVKVISFRRSRFPVNGQPQRPSPNP